RLVGSWQEGDRELFRDDPDRWRFLDSLGKRVELYGVRLHHYVMMANHFHLVVETPQANCSAFMQSLLTSYTVYFNLRHSRHGHLFDGRYKAKLVQGDAYLLGVSRYVHLNPVRVSSLATVAERRKVLGGYYWSSYLQYIGRRKKLECVTFAPTLALASDRRAPQLYREYVEAGLSPDIEEWGLGEASPLSIGDTTFRDEVQERYVELVRSAKRPEDVAFRRVESALEPAFVLDQLAAIMECERACFSARCHGQPHRPFAAHFLTRFAGLSRRESAQHLGVSSGPAVTQLLSRYRHMVTGDRRLRNLADLCATALERESLEHC
ncbi:MAG: transposase, partial [Lentisphaerae bacterium]|nr:transposase [Lentisphaerota bacterium]